MNIPSNLGPIQPLRPPTAPPVPGDVPPDVPAVEQFVPSSPSQPVASWTSVQTQNQVSADVFRDQGSQTNKALVATLSPGPLLPVAVKLEWNVDPKQPLKATLVDRPQVQLQQPILAEDGNIYLQLEPNGPTANPNAPFVVFNPQTMDHGLADPKRADGRGGFQRTMQEIHNADGTFTILANEQVKVSGDGKREHSFTRVDAGPSGMQAKDVTIAPAFGSLVELPKETPATDVAMTAQGLQVTHGVPKSYLPSMDQVKEKAAQFGDQVATTATNLNKKASGMLSGRLKELFDYGMKGGLLGAKGYNVGQGLWNKTSPPDQPASTPPPRVSVLHPFSPILASNPGALFPGLATLLQATAQE